MKNSEMNIINMNNKMLDFELYVVCKKENHHNDEYISNSSKLNSRIKGHSNAFGTICRILVTIS